MTKLTMDQANARIVQIEELIRDLPDSEAVVILTAAAVGAAKRARLPKQKFRILVKELWRDLQPVPRDNN